MSLGPFLSSLFDHGRVTVDPELLSGADGLERIESILLEQDTVYRRMLPGQPPPFEAAAAIKAAVTLYRGCQCLVYREYSAEDVERAIVIPPPSLNPAEHLSVDLVYRFLPDLVRLARAASPDDLLVKRLLALAQCWPLSSAGVAGVEAVDTRVLATDRWIWQFYTERVLERGDTTRMADPVLRQTVREAVGAHTRLVMKHAQQLDMEAISKT